MSMPTLSACAAQAIHFLPDGDRLGCLSSPADGPGSLTASHIIFTARPFLDLRSAHYILILERIQDAAGRISDLGGRTSLAFVVGGGLLQDFLVKWLPVI